MGKFSDTRRHKSWDGPYVNAQISDRNDAMEDISASRMLVFTAPFGEGSEVPRIFSNYEKKLKFNPGIIADLYENIISAMPQKNITLPDEDSMEIITSKNWHPGLFGPDEKEEAVKEDAVRYLQEKEPGAVIKKTFLLHIQLERCLVLCVLL